METHLRIIGFLLIALAILHIPFPKYFKWKTELQPLSLLTRQIFYVHTFFIVVVIVFMAVLCICFTNDLLKTHLGHYVLLGLSVFWGLRLIIQLFIYSPKLWKGKPFETGIHILFSILWTYFTLVFVIALVSSCS